MFLKSLEMQGFKSFPDKTVLKLEKGITGVVGPNGSGKSNISDAVRWVLGEQSSKSLRGSKMEDVVFSGNAGGRKAHGFAEVTLRLDNTDRSLNYDDDEVAVTRRYYRSGESEYILNGEGVRLRDINELFMDTGLGRDGYSMVSQGRIADLVSSKSAQRREMLEEAAGISHYRYRRADAKRKLDQAEENLIRLRDILSELESRVGPLKNQSEKAKKFLVLAEEKKELEIGLWLHTIEKSRNLLKEQEEKLVVATAQYEDAEKELSSIEEELESLTAKSQGIAVSVDFIHRSNEALEEQVAKLDSQAAVEENSIEHNNETIERLTRDIEALTSSKEDVVLRITEEENNILEIEKKIEAKKAELFYRKEVPGFKDYPCDAEITEVPVIGANGDTVNCVYRYVGWNENADFDEVDIIESDCYVDYAEAETAFREAQKMLQRKEWAINRYIVGQCDWRAGFIRVRD